MRIYPFRGIRYANSGEAGPLAGPPYDQIDRDLQRQLHRQPLHFAHLIRPAVASGDPHQAASDLHREWLEGQVLTQDRTPALYPYEIRLRAGARRLGLCALVGLETPASNVIRPHEATLAKTVDERLSLLRRTRIDLEPILMLAEDRGRLDQLLEEDLRSSQPLMQHQDIDGNQHLLHRIEDAERLARYQSTLASTIGLIADGHHRYTVASRYADEIQAQPGTPAAAKLAVITSLSAEAVRIDPIHRLLEQPIAVERVRRWASSCHPIEAAAGAEVAALVAGATQPALGASVGPRTELWTFDATMAPTSMGEHLRHLSVSWLHDILLPEAGLPATAATDGTVVYRSDPQRLYAELRDGSAAVGFWLPPISGEDFARAMTSGGLLPPKSTRFLPKVASGLVWAAHDIRLSSA